LAKRAQKLNGAVASGEPGGVLAAVDDEMTCDDVRCPADVQKLNTLELYRLGFVPDLPADVRAARASAWGAALPREPITCPISDDGTSWRDRCDRAVSDDSGADRDDDAER
jgi:hypothetical protein